jgi:hypothetical protein
MSEAIRCTAWDAATKYSHLVGESHLVKYVSTKRETWAYYEFIQVLPGKIQAVKVARIYGDWVNVNRWQADDLVDLVPIKEIHEDDFPQSTRLKIAAKYARHVLQNLIDDPASANLEQIKQDIEHIDFLLTPEERD